MAKENLRRRRKSSGKRGPVILQSLFSEHGRSEIGLSPRTRNTTLWPISIRIPVNKLRAGEGTLTTCDKEVVAALGQDIAQRIGEPRFNFWFEGNTKFTLEEQALTVGVPNLFFQDWLQNTFGESVRAAACEVLGRPVQVRFAIDSELFQKSRRAQEERGLRVEDHGSAVKDRGLSIEDRATRTLNSGLAQ